MNLFRCSHCEHQIESNKKSIKHCPQCKGKDCVFEATHYKLDNGSYVLYKYNEGPYISVRLGDDEVKTLDHLGRRNYERDEKLGIVADKEGKEKEKADKEYKENLNVGKYKKIKTKKDKPWWRDTKRVDTSLAQLNDKQLDNYIMTGKK